MLLNIMGYMGGARERVWPFVAAAAYFGAISSKVVSVPPKARISHFDISNSCTVLARKNANTMVVDSRFVAPKHGATAFHQSMD